MLKENADDANFIIISTSKKDGVVDKAPKQPMTHTGTHSIKSITIRAMANCHTPFRERGNDASIRVPKMFKSHI
jgi:hypothetical protein